MVMGGRQRGDGHVRAHRAHPLDGHVPISYLSADMRWIRFLQPFIHRYRTINDGTQPNIAQPSDQATVEKTGERGPSRGSPPVATSFSPEL